MSDRELEERKMLNVAGEAKALEIGYGGLSTGTFIHGFHHGFQYCKTCISGPLSTEIKDDSIPSEEKAFVEPPLIREDIESFGWEHDQTTKDGADYYIGTLIDEFQYRLNSDRNNETIINIWDVSTTYKSNKLFEGVVKNKSELKVLLNQIGVIKH